MHGEYTYYSLVEYQTDLDYGKAFGFSTSSLTRLYYSLIVTILPILPLPAPHTTTVETL